MPLTFAAGLALWAFVTIIVSYAVARHGPARVLPPVLYALVIVVAIELLAPTASPKNWQLIGSASVLGFIASIIAWLFIGKDSQHTAPTMIAYVRARRVWDRFRSDVRLIVMAVAFAVALTITFLFAKIAQHENPPAFWEAFYAAWTSSLVFFTILGLAGTLVTLSRPEKEQFLSRVRILFGGRWDEAVEYISDRIRRIGYYSEDMDRTYTIKDYDADYNAFLIRVVHRSVTRNYYDDVEAKDEAVLKLMPDSPESGFPQVGRLLWFKIENENKIDSPVTIPSSGIHRTWEIEIPRGATRTLEVCHECWYSVVETHDFTPSKFVKCLRARVIVEGGLPGTVVIQELLPSQKEARLAFQIGHAFPLMANRRPGEVALSFRLSLESRPVLASASAA